MQKTEGRIDIHSRQPKINEKDRKIISLLAKNARTPFNEIAKKVLLSSDAVKYRMKRLEKTGIIRRYTTDISFRQLGFYRYNVFIEVAELHEQKEKQLLKTLREHPNIISVIQYTDKYDFEIVIVAKNVNDFDDVVRKLQHGYEKIINGISTYQQIKSYKSRFIPSDFSKEMIATPEKKLPADIKIDKLDMKILAELSKNSRESSIIIAKKLKTSHDTVIYRMKKMQENDLLHRFVPVINFSALGFNLYTTLISLKSLTNERESELMGFIKQHKHIIRCTRGIGSWDIVAYILAKNQPDFHRTINDLRFRFRRIIRHYDTLLGYREHKYNLFPEALVTQVR